jgi:hypothetical protein
LKPTVEGIYSEGKVTLNERIPVKNRSKVLVVFLEGYQDKANKKECLMKTFGSWDDDKDAAQIVQEIYNDRVSKKEDIRL